ncbi:dephospho-CoA kinase [Thalassotalea algicola]|uniref:dephospho-CoA kinase n=1 Tax=Thalassotalea algicola TaxID=2716224 RepID=UPI002E2D451F|nr:dephospho-CoA kinase [Thalassotalea algicola]
MIIGLTGGIGSGKTTIANLFAQKDIDIVDADVVAREVVEPESVGLGSIIDHFGLSIIKGNGELDRAALREIVFTDESEKQWLNQLLHPLIRDEVFSQISACHSPYCILVAPLLLENQLDKHVNRVLVVDVPEEQQISRTAQRDNCDENIVKNIINAQITRELRLSRADDIIDNSKSDFIQIEQSVDALHKHYLQLAANEK